MELGPVFRALLYTRSRFWLIAVEIALTLAVAVNCIAMIQDMRAEIMKPTGLDVDNLLVLRSRPFGDEPRDDNRVEQDMEQDLQSLRALPGVRAATAITAVPLSGGGSATGRRAAGSDSRSLLAPFYVVTSDALATLGVELEAGRDLVPEDVPPELPAGTRPLHNNV